jgi:CelD/BcsL family acetyltransferase involved in cellulose biosynthesis
MNQSVHRIPGESSVRLFPLSQETTVHFRHEIRTIEALDGFKSIRLEWEALTAASDDYSLCATYQYCELAASVVFAKGGIIAVVMVYDDHGLQALWPLAIYREGFLRIAKALTCGSDEEYGGPLIKSKLDRMIVTAVLGAVMQVRADILEVRWVQDGSILQELLQSAPQSWLLPLQGSSKIPGYFIRLRGFTQWEEYAATLPQKLRANLRRDLKRLNAKGHTEFGWCTTVDDTDVVLTWLFANKQRWAKTRGINLKYVMDERVRNFFMALARRIDLSATPLVAFVKVDGFPVAASVNLVGPSSVEGFITTYDEAFSTYSVGSLLVDFLVRWSFANGRDFDLRVLHAEYKARWANNITSYKMRIIIFLSGRGRIEEFSSLTYGVGRRFRMIAFYVFETVKARTRRSLMSSRSRE